MNNPNQLFYLALALAGIILAMLAMFFNYNLKLDARTVKLEKKNGHEQHQIDQLRQELAEQKELNLQLIVKVQQLETKLSETKKN